MEALKPELAAERKARRMLLVTAIAALIVIVIGMTAAVIRLHQEAFSRPDWDHGKGKLTQDNPRLRMQRDVNARIRRGMTREDVIALLGPPDPSFAVKSPMSSSQIYTGGPDGMAYILGVKPKTMVSPPQLQVLIVFMDANKRVSYSYVNEEPFEAGSKIVPAKPLAAGPSKRFLPPTTKGKPTPAKKKPAGP